MNGIIAMSHMLSQSDLTADQRDCVDTVLESANAMMRLLNDLLLSSKIGAGQFTLNPAPFRLDRLLKHIHDVMRSRIAAAAQTNPSKAQIQVNIQRCPRLPTFIVADSDRLKQVRKSVRASSEIAGWSGPQPVNLTAVVPLGASCQVLENLCDNALKFTHAGSITLTARTCFSESRQNQISTGVEFAGRSGEDCKEVSAMPPRSSPQRSLTPPHVVNLSVPAQMATLEFSVTDTGA